MYNQPPINPENADDVEDVLVNIGNIPNVQISQEEMRLLNNRDPTMFNLHEPIDYHFIGVPMVFQTHKFLPIPLVDKDEIKEDDNNADGFIKTDFPPDGKNDVVIDNNPLVSASYEMSYNQWFEDNDFNNSLCLTELIEKMTKIITHVIFIATRSQDTYNEKVEIEKFMEGFTSQVKAFISYSKKSPATDNQIYFNKTLLKLLKNIVNELTDEQIFNEHQKIKKFFFAYNENITGTRAFPFYGFCNLMEPIHYTVAIDKQIKCYTGGLTLMSFNKNIKMLILENRNVFVTDTKNNIGVTVSNNGMLCTVVFPLGICESNETSTFINIKESASRPLKNASIEKEFVHGHCGVNTVVYKIDFQNITEVFYNLPQLTPNLCQRNFFRNINKNDSLPIFANNLKNKITPNDANINIDCLVITQTSTGKFKLEDKHGNFKIEMDPEFIYDKNKDLAATGLKVSTRHVDCTVAITENRKHYDFNVKRRHNGIHITDKKFCIYNKRLNYSISDYNIATATNNPIN